MLFYLVSLTRTIRLFDVVIFDILIPRLSINHVSFDRLIDFLSEIKEFNFHFPFKY